LFLEEFALARDVTAVTLGEDVFSTGLTVSRLIDASTDRSLDRHVEHLARMSSFNRSAIRRP